MVHVIGEQLFSGSQSQIYVVCAVPQDWAIAEFGNIKKRGKTKNIKKYILYK